MAQAQQQVAANNAADAADVVAFNSNGWNEVPAVVPDLALVAFDPKLIADGRESDLRAQLASTSPKDADVPNIVAIAQQTQNTDVRVQAVRAISRVDTPQAQQALITLATVFAPSEPARQDCLGALKPPSVDDVLTQQITALINDARLSAAEQQEIAFTVALLQAREHKVVDGLPPAAQLQVDAMTQLLRGVQ